MKKMINQRRIDCKFAGSHYPAGRELFSIGLIRLQSVLAEVLWCMAVDGGQSCRAHAGFRGIGMVDCESPLRDFAIFSRDNDH
jgi:hypothetical protein